MSTLIDKYLLTIFFQIEIVYEVVMVSIRSYSEGDEFWTSCGMLYDGGSNLWISQISFTLTETIAVRDLYITCSQSLDIAGLNH